jgi:hypothetical protein
VLFLMRREHLSARPSQDGIFAECKPVDDNHSVGEHYCDRGIGRFIKGDYAWAMQDAVMIAYVRGGRTISKDLVPALAVKLRRADLGYPSSPTVVNPSCTFRATEALQSTLHRRSFPWPGGRGTACQIRVFHSWHACC